MNTAYINNSGLKSARNNAGLSVNYLADKIKVSQEKYLMWENGKTYPSFAQAQEMAKSLFIPFGYLYLDEIPERKLAIPDFRTLDREKYPLNQDFFDQYDLIAREQEWYKEYLKNVVNTQPLSFVNSFSISNNVFEVVDALREILGISFSEQCHFGQVTDLITKIIDRCAEKNVSVSRSGIVGCNTRRPIPVEDYRGFVICDDIAPFIFINSRDNHYAQVFTLIHELTHLLLGNSGVINFRENEPIFKEYTIEHFCNKVATNFLMPEDEIKNIESKDIFYLKRRAKRINVSFQAFLIRIKELYMIDEIDYQNLMKENHKYIVSEKKKTSGGNFYNNFGASKNIRIIKSVSSCVKSGDLLYTEAATILGTSVKVIEGLVK